MLNKVLSLVGCEKVKRLINLNIRAATLVSKFALIFFMAKYLDAKDVGIYGLVAATIGYAIYLVGFEFYNYSTREIIGSDPDLLFGYLKDQVVLYAIAYVLVLPLVVVFFSHGFIAFEYIYWFGFLLVVEHLAQELNRVLVAVSQQMLASVVLFVRSGVWCLVVILAIFLWPKMRNLNFVFLLWFLGCLFALFIGFWGLRSYSSRSFFKPVNWAWIRKGLRLVWPLLIASLCIRGIFTIDRYWIEQVAGLDALGAYVLYIGMATAVLSFLDAAVIVFYYPKLILLAKSYDYRQFSASMRGLTFNVVGFTLFLSVACYFCGWGMTLWLDKIVYVEYFYVLKWLILAMALYSFSMIPHVGLYALHKDSHIFFSQVGGLMVFLVSYFAMRMANVDGVTAVLWGMCNAFVMIFIWKSLAYVFCFRLIKKDGCDVKP
ncbi:oligosaccharide flippase family protein [Pseudomonas sp. P97.38]|uniref:oligosaccharide flippase family protein n=1 Tax=Pseudomonas sp. P97.38 TaxID=255451 RepID=UPI0012EE9BCD|nr:oligosaccharide flippase family protein [Pseudomonas sp. P97.38]